MKKLLAAVSLLAVLLGSAALIAQPAAKPADPKATEKKENPAEEKEAKWYNPDYRPYVASFDELYKLGDDFAITGIKRQGPGAENFERLSAGTQEQIAVLVRLAMGAMLGERGQPVPIILDDALVNTDEGRLDRMHLVLHKAAQAMQVLVLTCRERDFLQLGAPIVRI